MRKMKIKGPLDSLHRAVQRINMKPCDIYYVNLLCKMQSSTHILGMVVCSRGKTRTVVAAVS